MKQSPEARCSELGTASKSADDVQRGSDSATADVGDEALAALRRAGAVKLVTGPAGDPSSLVVLEAASYLDGVLDDDERCDYLLTLCEDFAS